MKESFDELYELLKTDRAISGWSKKQSLLDRHAHLASEVVEIKEALENKDHENLREELGDALYDLLAIVVICEEQGICSGKDVVIEALEKIKRRKPWLLTGEEMTSDQEEEHWQKIKAQEKANKI